MRNLAVEFCGCTYQNPVSTASGTYGFGIEYGQMVPVEKLGSITTKGLTYLPRKGNPGRRLCETPSGMLNAIGLENPGVDAFLKEILPQMAERLGDARIIANIDGDSEKDYAALAERLDEAQEVSALEVNISCPNVACGGMAFGTDPKMAVSVLQAVKAKTKKPVIMKLSPNVTDITLIAKALEAEGADALSLINTLLGMVIDVDKKRPMLGNRTGGLSGPAVRPIGVRMTWQVAEVVKIPILAMGGIATARDALEYILAGASMVAVGAAGFANPWAPFEVLAGIDAYMNKHGIKNVQDLVGLAHR